MKEKKEPKASGKEIVGSKAQADVRQSKSLKNGSSKMSMDHKEKKKEKKDGEDYSDEFEKDADKQEEKKDENPGLDMAAMRSLPERCKRKFQRIYNRLEFNQHLNNKKALFMNMRNYYNYCCGTGDKMNESDDDGEGHESS